MIFTHTGLGDKVSNNIDNEFAGDIVCLAMIVVDCFLVATITILIIPFLPLVLLYVWLRRKGD